MKTESAIPHPLLSQIITAYHYLTFEPDYENGQNADHKIVVLPSHKQYLSVNLSGIRIAGHLKKYGEEKEGLFVIGHQLLPVEVTHSSAWRAVMIEMQPGSLFRLFHIPMYNFENKCTDAEQIIGRETRPLVERLMNTFTSQEIWSVLDAFFLRLLQKPLFPNRLDVPFLTSYINTYNVKQLANYTGLSIRQFERTFKEHIGTSLRLYKQLIRFNTAYMIKEKEPSVNWTKVAYSSGYFDQMHFIRDFKKFSGTTPMHIRAEKIIPSPFHGIFES